MTACANENQGQNNDISFEVNAGEGISNLFDYAIYLDKELPQIVEIEPTKVRWQSPYNDIAYAYGYEELEKEGVEAPDFQRYYEFQGFLDEKHFNFTERFNFVSNQLDSIKYTFKVTTQNELNDLCKILCEQAKAKMFKPTTGSYEDMTNQDLYGDVVIEWYWSYCNAGIIFTKGEFEDGSATVTIEILQSHKDASKANNDGTLINNESDNTVEGFDETWVEMSDEILNEVKTLHYFESKIENVSGKAVENFFDYSIKLEDEDIKPANVDWDSTLEEFTSAYGYKNLMIMPNPGENESELRYDYTGRLMYTSDFMIESYYFDENKLSYMTYKFRPKTDFELENLCKILNEQAKSFALEPTSGTCDDILNVEKQEINIEWKSQKSDTTIKIQKVLNDDKSGEILITISK